MGTPATRAAILKLLYDRDYIREDRKKLYASRKGLFLLDQLGKNENLKKITDISQTTEWEKQLSGNPQEFEQSIVPYLKNCIGSAKTDTYTVEPIGICPRCGKEIREGKKSYYCSGYQGEPPCSFLIFKTVSGTTLSAGDVALLLSHKTTGIKNCVSKSGKKFKAAFSMGHDGNIVFHFDSHLKGGKSFSKQTKEEVKHGAQTV
jgi:DNA topoisomerase-3